MRADAHKILTQKFGRKFEDFYVKKSDFITDDNNNVISKKSVKDRKGGWKSYKNWNYNYIRRFLNKKIGQNYNKIIEEIYLSFKGKESRQAVIDIVTYCVNTSIEDRVAHKGRQFVSVITGTPKNFYVCKKTKTLQKTVKPVRK